MSAKILEWRGLTKLPTPPDQVLDGAKGKLDEVLILGWQEDGELWASSSQSNLDRALFLIEQFRFRMMRGDYS